MSARLQWPSKKAVDREKHDLLLMIFKHTFPPIPFCVLVLLFLALEHYPGLVYALVSIFTRYLGFQERDLAIQPFELCGKDGAGGLRSGFTFKQR